jgi:hypothetical protein
MSRPHVHAVQGNRFLQVHAGCKVEDGPRGKKSIPHQIADLRIAAGQIGNSPLRGKAFRADLALHRQQIAAKAGIGPWAGHPDVGMLSYGREGNTAAAAYFQTQRKCLFRICRLVRQGYGGMETQSQNTFHAGTRTVFRNRCAFPHQGSCFGNGFGVCDAYGEPRLFPMDLVESGFKGRDIRQGKISSNGNRRRINYLSMNAPIAGLGIQPGFKSDLGRQDDFVAQNIVPTGDVPGFRHFLRRPVDHTHDLLLDGLRAVLPHFVGDDQNGAADGLIDAPACGDLLLGCPIQVFPLLNNAFHHAEGDIQGQSNGGDQPGAGQKGGRKYLGKIGAKKLRHETRGLGAVLFWRVRSIVHGKQLLELKNFPAGEAL